MKTGIKAAVIVATVFAGTLVVEAQQQRTQQKKGQPSGNRIHQCPNCGWSPQRQQGRGNTQVQGQRPQQRRQFQNQAPQRQGRPQSSPEQRQQAIQRRKQFQAQNQQQPNRQNPQFQARRDRQNAQQQQQVQQKRQRQRILKRFDADGDGQLSEKERKQMKKAWKQHQKNNGTEGRQERPPKPAIDN